MGLENLLGISLERVEADPMLVQRLLQAAQRNILDAELEGLSNENCFDTAYKAVMQLANASLQASGYRTLTSRPGHQRTMIQALPQTIGISADTMIVLDSLRKQRNVADYSGDLVSQAAVVECVMHAKALRDFVDKRLRKDHPDLLG